MLGFNMCREFIVLIISGVFNNLLIYSTDSKVELMLLIVPFDNYVIWPAWEPPLMNREPIILRNLLMKARLQDQKVCVTQLSKRCIPNP